jgi:hypothetical protein
VRGDVVDVVAVRPGKTKRQTMVEFVLRKKVRPRGALDVGDRSELGIVSFAAWATPP